MDASRCAGTLSKTTAEAAAEAAGSGGIKGEPGMGTERREERLPTSRRVEERNAAARLRANGSTGGDGTSAGAQRWADTRREVPKPAGATARHPKGSIRLSGGQASVDLQALGAANWDDWGGLARRARFQGAQLGGCRGGRFGDPFFPSFSPVLFFLPARHSRRRCGCFLLPPLALWPLPRGIAICHCV